MPDRFDTKFADLVNHGFNLRTVVGTVLDCCKLDDVTTATLEFESGPLAQLGTSNSSTLAPSVTSQELTMCSLPPSHDPSPLKSSRILLSPSLLLPKRIAVDSAAANPAPVVQAQQQHGRAR